MAYVKHTDSNSTNVYVVVTLWYPFGGNCLSMRFDKWCLTAIQMGSKLDGVGPLKQFFIGPTILF